jgi:hypothetical protein
VAGQSSIDGLALAKGPRFKGIPGFVTDQWNSDEALARAATGVFAPEEG